MAEGQHEINFRYADALRTADNAISMKLTLKLRPGARPSLQLHAQAHFWSEWSGMHVHESLESITDGTNKFYDEAGTYGLSALAQSFIAVNSCIFAP